MLNAAPLQKTSINGVRYYKVGQLILPSVSEVLKVAIPKPSLERWKSRHSLDTYEKMIVQSAAVIHTPGMH